MFLWRNMKKKKKKTGVWIHFLYGANKLSVILKYMFENSSGIHIFWKKKTKKKTVCLKRSANTFYVIFLSQRICIVHWSETKPLDDSYNI